MEFLKLAHERYSCRSLSSAPVEQEKIDRILEAALAAPTAKNQQPFRIWVLRSAEAKAAADLVADDIDEDGVWNALVRLGLL